MKTNWTLGPLGYGTTIRGHRVTVRSVVVVIGKTFARRWQILIDGAFARNVYATSAAARAAAETLVAALDDHPIYKEG